MTFDELAVPADLIAALNWQRISEPTAIQAAALPVLPGLRLKLLFEYFFKSGLLRLPAPPLDDVWPVEPFMKHDQILLGHEPQCHGFGA